MVLLHGKNRFMRGFALVLAVLCAVFCPAGCAPEEQNEESYMRTAAKELVDVLWNIDYNTFTPEKATAYAKKYYESQFLKEFLDDINTNAGIPSIKEEKLVAKVLSTGEGEAAEEQLGDTVYKKYTMKGSVEVKNYEPVYPEDSILEAGKTYDLLFTLYFGEENGKLKLVAYAYEPQDGVFLPKRANNVKLSSGQIGQIKEIAQNYCRTRYDFDYQTYAPEAAFSFFKKNATAAFIENEGLTQNYLNDFYKDIKTYQMRSTIESLRVLAVDENKSAVNMPDGMQFYYIAAVQTQYSLEATGDFFRQAQMKKGEVYVITEYLGFELVGGKFRIAFTDYS